MYTSCVCIFSGSKLTQNKRLGLHRGEAKEWRIVGGERCYNYRFPFLYSPIWQIIDLETVNFKNVCFMVLTIFMKFLEQEMHNLHLIYMS